jgi:hypothetical protein
MKTDEKGRLQFRQEYLDSEDWRLVLGEVLRAVDTDPGLLESGWSTYEAVTATDPNHIPIDRAIPDWDSLSPAQQGAILALCRLPQWSELSFTQSEAFRRAFERMLNRVVLDAGIRLATLMSVAPQHG